eukprot:TRINITY_DN23019_c0_g1_i1.p2 TRINITY_DN23019_c0_g1~~TRINITY_DN23019_c0_g1_i1.p2  ORF type:complete len:555 (+),score=186.00 TRINITY_DN23019_c0_g1_i1:169-1833(+)
MALPYLRRAVELDGRSVEALEYLAHELFYIGGTHTDKPGYVEEAVELWQKALAIDAKHTLSLKSLYECAVIVGLFDIRQQLIATILPSHEDNVQQRLPSGDAQEKPRLMRPFSQELVIPIDIAVEVDELSSQMLFDTARVTAQDIVNRANAMLPDLHFNHPRPPRKHNRIRLGYLSSWFKDHPVGFVIQKVFKFHDRERFEVFCYSAGAHASAGALGDVRGTIRRDCEHFEDFVNRTYSDMARKIYNDQIDILVDLNGLYAGHKLEVLAKRPAPIQMHLHAFGHSTAAPFIDYFVADPVTCPPEAREFFTENIMYMPDTYFVNSHRHLQLPFHPLNGTDRSRSFFKLPTDKFIFASFGNVGKVTPAMFERWMNILRRVPNSVLWMRPWESGKSALVKRAAEAGIWPDRFVWGKYLDSYSESLERANLVDVHLDTSPYGAHVTAADSLWAGTPLVTSLTDLKLGSRVGASLLKSLGLPELVAHSWEEYEDIAVRLASDHSFYRSVRERLWQNRLTRPAFDTQLWVRHFESGLETVWKRHCDGLPPSDLVVKTLYA